MNRKTILALALASAFGLSSFAAFADDEKKDEKPQLVAEDDSTTDSPYTDKVYVPQPSAPQVIADDEKKDEKPQLIADDEKKDEKPQLNADDEKKDEKPQLLAIHEGEKDKPFPQDPQLTA